MLRLQVIVCFCSLVLGVFVSPPFVLAQTAEIVGTVRDDIGGVLPGVIVQLRGESMGLRESTTDGQGTYRFDNLSPGPARSRSP